MSETTTPTTPLYLPIKEAAKYAGISQEMMRQFANAPLDSIPHIESGKKKLIRVSAIAGYLEKKERR